MKNNVSSDTFYGVYNLSLRQTTGHEHNNSGNVARYKVTMRRVRATIAAAEKQ